MPTARRVGLRRTLTSVGAAVAIAGLLSACSGDGEDPEPDSTSSASALPPPPSATPAPTPATDACHRLTYQQALAPTASAKTVPCGDNHTSQTFAVDQVDSLVDGHLLAVDSTRVRNQVAQECPSRLPGYLGADQETMRLSMLRSVWFTPTLEEAAAGGQWFRCDVVAVAQDEKLATLTGQLKNALATDSGADRYAMCGTADPESEDFVRVMCSQQHSWRALSSVDLVAELGLKGQQPDYPGRGAVRDAGQDICQDAGEAAAEDALDYQWSYEWPSKRQWDAGQTYGLCWAPA